MQERALRTQLEDVQVETRRARATLAEVRAEFARTQALLEQVTQELGTLEPRVAEAEVQARLAAYHFDVAVERLEASRDKRRAELAPPAPPAPMTPERADRWTGRILAVGGGFAGGLLGLVASAEWVMRGAPLLGALVVGASVALGARVGYEYGRRS